MGVRWMLVLWLAAALAACSNATAVDGDGDGDADVDGDGDGDDDRCARGEHPVVAGWSLTPDVSGGENADVEERCTVQTIDDVEGGWGLGMLCETDDGSVIARILAITATPEVDPPLVAEGDDVVLRATAELIWWVNRHFTLRSAAGALLLAGVNAETLVPTGVDGALWYEPLRVESVDGHCPLIAGDCGDLEPMGVRVGLGESSLELYGDGVGWIGATVSYQALVGDAHRYETIECTDTPEQFYTALFVLVPEG